MTNYKDLKVYRKSQINGLTKHLAGLRFGHQSTQDMWDAIFNRAKELDMKIGYSQAHGERIDFIKPRKITKEQTVFGKTWLKEYFFKKDGSLRSGKRTEYVGSRVFNIAKSVSKFEFVGVQVLASNGWYPSQVVPIYRAYNRKGEYFDYAPIHWGEPIFMEGN